jgi:hypothetical protein
MQRAEYAFKSLLVAAMLLSRFSAGAGQFRSRMIAGAGIQPLFQRSRGQPQSLPPRRCLQCFQIQMLDGLMAYERFDLRNDFILEVCLEPPFLTSSEEAVAFSS